MKLLLDTHILVWLATERNKLTRAEMSAIEGDNDLLASPLSIWEVRLKYRRLRATGTFPSPEALLGFIDRSPIAMATLDGLDFAAPLAVPVTHKDPFDEMLLVQAQRFGARVLTRDRDMAGHPLVLQP